MQQPPSGEYPQYQPQNPQSQYYVPQGPQQPWQAQPQYPQSMPPQQPPVAPPAKKRHFWRWIILTAIIGIFIGYAAHGSGSSSASPATTTSAVATTAPQSAATAAPTTKPAQTQHYKVGQAVTIGNTYQVTINSVKTSSGDEISQPTSGNTFLVIDVTTNNISNQEQSLSSALNFTLQDSTGQKYTETIMNGATPPDGKIEAGGKLRGQLVYEVPSSMKSFTLAFESNIFTSGQTLFDIGV